jgi:ABC-type Fe3+/spermidine/putrescine transport system ATPase subunit
VAVVQRHGHQGSTLVNLNEDCPVTNPVSDIAAPRSVAPATGDSAVEIRGVSKWFGEVTALDNVSFDIRRGEFFSLLGPSGCGKTTLLRMIGGFETPSEGQILIDGVDTYGAPPYARSTNMIFQHLALFPHMNVLDNVSFGLKMKRLGDEVIKQKVHQALDLVRLEGYGERKIDQLSGGQKQRVAMARALINDPSVLLLDEPLGALDLQLRLQMQDELRRLHKSLGNTFIFVTHDVRPHRGDGSGSCSANRHPGRYLRSAANALRRRFCRPHQCVRWSRHAHRR